MADGSSVTSSYSDWVGLGTSVFLTPSQWLEQGVVVLIFLCEYRPAQTLQTHCWKVPFSSSNVTLCVLDEEQLLSGVLGDLLFCLVLLKGPKERLLSQPGCSFTILKSGEMPTVGTKS